MSCKEEDDLPILVTANLQAKGRAKPLNTKERELIYDLPDSQTSKIPMALALYPGAYMLVNNNINTSCSLAQGSRCRVVSWEFPENTQFISSVYRGAKVRLPICDDGVLLKRVQPTCVFVKMENSLRNTPAGQPSGLPKDVVALPLFTLEATISLNKLYANDRASVKTNIQQLPLRPANSLTSYACIGCEFDKYIIYDTNPKEFYTQISRGKKGLDSVVLAIDIKKKKGFKPSPQESVPIEMQRLQVYP
mmetsp:Transcript_15963/g.18823  ORF Transcript_15963/g.18823 Transcript_15963/m.18823 type:complete len:249 (+) Transcript_15963:196-942(+)